MANNLYLLLGVSTNATAQEIKAAFRRQAKDSHPDRGGNEERFRALQQAYETLSNPHSRQHYDRALRRPAGPRPLAEPMRAPGGRRARGVHPLRPRADEFESCRPSFDELFERFWSNFDDLTRPKAERVESLTVEVPLSPGEAMEGGRVTVLIPARVECPACQGRGSLAGYECWRCEGRGALTAEYPVEVRYPAGIASEYLRQISLDQFGITNFYLTVRFRVTHEAW